LPLKRENFIFKGGTFFFRGDTISADMLMIRFVRVDTLGDGKMK
jgi:hypothetical protein